MLDKYFMQHKRITDREGKGGGRRSVFFFSGHFVKDFSKRFFSQYLPPPLLTRAPSCISYFGKGEVSNRDATHFTLH